MSDTASNILTRLESILQCPVCLELLDEPRVLTCGHVFCYGCIRRLVGRMPRLLIKCPTCQRSSNVNHVTKVFILKDILDTQKSITNSSTPMEICEQCEQSLKLDELWACPGCDAKSMCSKCMVKKSHGKCDAEPRLLCDLLEEKKTYLENWRRTVYEKQVKDLSISMKTFSNRVANMRQVVPTLRTLLRERLLEQNGAEKMGQYANELESILHDCEAIMDLALGNGTLGNRLATCVDNVSEQEDRMRILMVNLESSSSKFDRCLEALSVFATSIRNILDDEVHNSEPQVQEVNLGTGEAASVADISDFGLGVGNGGEINGPVNADCSVPLIVLDADDAADAA